ncbi:carbonic anhydrase 4 [Ictalurus punctatus]|uniref:Carbonic anhydrase n=1 Tax=Ictalurus punctatus TaxID=7998 RepID=W5U8N7_ICTPU|nr:carbonic anhydrase 4 [Ictalurus punctatus]
MDVQLVPFFIVCLLSTVYSEGSVEFCYNSPGCNATTWPTIAPLYCNGTRQSPINIVTADVKADNNLTAFSFTGFNDSSTFINIQNTGKSVKIHLDDQKMSVSGGGLQNKYKSKEFHIHWGNGSSFSGSEHTVDGKQYAMEMHIVNLRADVSVAAANDSTAYAVLGFFIEATNDSGKPESWKNLTSFLSNIPKKGDLLDIMNQLTVDSLLEGVDRTKYYRYLGSLTTPACNEIVVWTVFKDPVKVSKDLIDLFSNTVHIDTTADPFITNNYRILQALNGRVVTSQPTSSANTTSSASTLHHTLSISTALLYCVFFWCL